VSENNLRVKRRDPWLRANAPSKAVADPGLVVETRRANHRRVFIWFASWWRNHQLKQAEKPHSKFSDAVVSVDIKSAYDAILTIQQYVSYEPRPVDSDELNLLRASTATARLLYLAGGL
jgi:hypothetical protein